PGYFAAAPPPPTRERRSAGATAALVAVAVVVAIGAGGSVYAFMNGDGAGKTASRGPSASAQADGGGQGRGEGGVPEGFLGTWSGSIPGEQGPSTRTLTIRQGDVGDQVLALTAEGPLESGSTYHCEFTAPLSGPAAGDGPVRIGPSTVSSGRPATSCTPGKPTELALLPDGSLRRTTTGTGESLIYTKSN
ncbi:serine/threonine protein kinase, partial [Streptomyces sp. RHZ10]|nr:serine/threonine protein kinase [Streptomyces durocortorensis]